MLSYCPKPIGCFNEGELLQFSVKKFGMVKQRQKWWEEVAAYMQSLELNKLVMMHGFEILDDTTIF